MRDIGRMVTAFDKRLRPVGLVDPRGSELPRVGSLRQRLLYTIPDTIPDMLKERKVS